MLTLNMRLPNATLQLKNENWTKLQARQLVQGQQRAGEYALYWEHEDEYSIVSMSPERLNPPKV